MRMVDLGLCWISVLELRTFVMLGRAVKDVGECAERDFELAQIEGVFDVLGFGDVGEAPIIVVPNFLGGVPEWR